MASRYSIETVFKAVDKFSNPTKRMQAVGKSFSKTLRNDFAKAERQMMRFKQNFTRTMKTGLMIGTGALAAGAVYAIKQGIELASDLTEVQNVVDTTFRDSAEQINTWSKTALKAYGLSELQAKKFSGTMGAMLKSSGVSEKNLVKMSSTLTGLMGDFASFYNLGHEETFTKIRAGISGETEPLKQIGINMSVANLEAFALTQNITKKWKAMTQGEQVMLRYNYLLSVSKDAQGDFSKTLATSWANQKRILQTKFAEKLAVAMSKLLPILIDAGKWLNNLLDKIDADKLSGNIEKAAKSIVNFAKGIIKLVKILKPYLILFGIFLALWKAYWIGMAMATFLVPMLKFIQIIIAITKVKGAWIAVQWALNAALTANPIGAIIVGITLLIGLAILIVIHWKKIVNWLKIGVEWLYKTYNAFQGLSLLLGVVATPFVVITNLIINLIKYWGFLGEAFRSEGMIGGIIAIGKVILTSILSPIESLFNLIGKIPGVGAKFKEWGLNIGDFRQGMFQAESPVTQGEQYAYSKEEKTQKGELTIKDETGRAEMKKPPTGSYYDMKLQRSGAF
jgi:hypothetical protein